MFANFISNTRKNALYRLTASILSCTMILTQTVIVPTAFAANTFIISATESTGKTKINPGWVLSYNIFLKNNNSSTDPATSPGIWVLFSDTHFTYSGSTWTSNQTPSGSGWVGFNPPTTNTGTFTLSALNVGRTAQLSNFQIVLGQDFTATGLTLNANGFASNFPTINANPISIAVNAVPHIKSYTFSKSAIINNGVDSTNLTVRVLDYNGCSNLSGGLSSVTLDLTAVGGGFLTSPSGSSCDVDGVTSIFTFNGIVTTNGLSTGAKTIAINVKDAEGHTANSDPNFTSDDTVSTTSLTVNSPTAPVITSLGVSPNPIGGGQNTTVSWQSSQTGSYLVNVGPGASCSSGTLAASWDVTTADSTINTVVGSNSLPEGDSQIVICVTNSEPTTGSALVAITKDSVAPTVALGSYLSSVTSQPVTVDVQSTELGTYRVLVNNIDTWVTGSVSAINTTINLSVPNVQFSNGDNSLKITVTDSAGNIGTSSTVVVNKDLTPPAPVTNVQLTDCDYVWNTGTDCASLGNPRSGMTGRDFSVKWDTPTSSGSFSTYNIYVLPVGTTLNTSVHFPVKVLGNFAATGAVLDNTTTTDSSGSTLPATGTGNYFATVLVKKLNGLYSTDASSTGAVITSDVITYPTLTQAAFTNNTSLTLTYNKSLSSTLSDYNSAMLSSSGCFSIDTTSWTWAKSASGNTVTFAVQPLGNLAKTCTDLAITGTGLIRDSENLYNEETLTGQTVLDRQTPTPITITSPTSNAFVGWNGAFQLTYSLPEAMSGATLRATFTDGSGATVNVSLSSNTALWSHNRTLTGSVIWLVDGKSYSLQITGEDVAGNAGSSNTMTNITYDITPPSVPVLFSPIDWVFTNFTVPVLVWLAATDNYSSAANINYQIEVSLVPDFSTTVATGSVLSGTGYTINTALLANTMHYWRVQAIDQAGNISGWCAAKDFTFDNTPPVISAVATDTYTQNTSRSFSGFLRNGDNAELRSVITDNFIAQMNATNVVADLTAVWGGASVQATTYNNTTGATKWTFATNCSSDGTKGLIITATDKAGNVSSRTVNVICDNTAPAIASGSILTPTQWAFLSGGVSYDITWNPSFYSTDLSPIATPIDIEYSTNGSSWTPVATAIANSGSYNWTVPSVNLPTAQLRFTATDKLGNSATVVRTFVIDSTNPSVAANTILSPNGGEYLKGSTGTGITITWNPAQISDTNIASTPVTLSYSTNGSTWTQIATGLANNGSYNWTGVPALNASTVRVKITVADLAGNISNDTSDSDFTVDSTLPNITVNTPPTPPNNAYISAGGFDIQTQGSDTNLSKISYAFDDGSLYWNESTTGWLGIPQWNDICVNAATCATANYTITPTLTDGNTYHLILRVTDLAGNTRDSSTYTYTADLVAPTITTSLVDNSYFSGSVNITGTSSDARSGVSSAKVSILRDSDNNYWSGTGGFAGTTPITLATSTSNAYATWSYTGFSMPGWDADGTSYTITRSATDNAYKTNNAGSGVIHIIKDATGPTIAANVWTNPATATFWEGSAPQTLTWNTGAITDLHSGVNQTTGITLEYYPLSGTGWITIASSIANSGSYVWNVPVLDTDLNIRIKTVDNAGNIGAGIISSTITVDSIAPTIQSIATMDQAASGKIDGLQVTMSEPIICSTVRASDFTIAGVGTPSSIWACSGNSATFILNFTAFGNTASKPTLTYTSGTLTDRANNLLLSAGPITPSDDAVPRILSASITDNNSNGKIDRIIVTWSEPIVASTNTAAWTINTPLPGVASTPTAVSTSSNTATLTISEPTAFNTSTGGMTLTFASNASWKDVANNLAGSSASVSLTDAAAPRIVTATTVDVGEFYTAQITFSETLASSSLSGFNLTGTSSFTGVITPVNSLIYQLITADSTTTDTSKTFGLDYSNAAAVADPSGNLLANITGLTVTDGIVPHILSRTTRDTNNNGKIDAIDVVYSESLSWTLAGYTPTIAGYSPTGSTKSGAVVTTTLTEWSVLDTTATPAVTINNASLTDIAGNLFPSDSGSTNATDGVGPVISESRYDGTNTVYVTLSEAFSGTLSNSSFVFSGSVVSVNTTATPTSTTAELTISGPIAYGTTEISTANNAVFDSANNAQSAARYVKVSPPVIINEVMWSGTGSSATQYIELHNLGTTSIDISNWTIDHATSGGTATLTIPSSSSIPANGYFLIAATATNNVGNLLANSITPDLVTSLSLTVGQIGNLVLKSNLSTTYDQAVVNPWPAGNDSLAYSMERKSSPGSGLNTSDWYTAQISGSFFDAAGPRGTPGSANVFDAVAPVISQSSIADSQILPSGNYTQTYDYTDDISISSLPPSSYLLEKNNGSGVYTDVTSASVTSSGANASTANFVLRNLASGAYRSTFGVRDAAGNLTQKITIFYVDNAQMSITNTNVKIGAVFSDSLTTGVTKSVITIRTVGTPFDLKLGGGTTLNAGINSIPLWNGGTWYGYGFACTPSADALPDNCYATIQAVNNTTVGTLATATPDVNGNLKTYTYTIEYSTKVDNTKPAGTYTGSATFDPHFTY